MGRATNSVRTERINTALRLLQEYDSLVTAAKAMVEAYGMSRRQAYRYLHEAQAQQQPLPIPASKIAFTVKLPPNLVEAVRQHAQDHQQPLSQIVHLALTAYLKDKDHSG